MDGGGPPVRRQAATPGKTISYTKLQQYYQCPFRYRLEYEEKVRYRFDGRPTFVGNVLARTVEACYKERWWAGPEDIVERGWARIPRIGIQVTLEQKLPWAQGVAKYEVARARECWPLIVDSMRRERLVGTQNWVELPLSVALGGWTINGRIDLLVLHPDDRLTLLDGKAGATVGKFVKGDQLRLYSLLTHAHFNRYPDRVGFWWYLHGVIRWKRFFRKTIDRFVAGVERTLARIDGGDRRPTPGWHCRVCPYRDRCPEGAAFLFSSGTLAGRIGYVEMT